MLSQDGRALSRDNVRCHRTSCRSVICQWTAAKILRCRTIVLRQRVLSYDLAAMVYNVDHHRSSFEHFIRWFFIWLNVRYRGLWEASYVKSRLHWRWLTIMLTMTYDDVRWPTMLPDFTIADHRIPSYALWDLGIIADLLGEIYAMVNHCSVCGWSYMSNVFVSVTWI